MAKMIKNAWNVTLCVLIIFMAINLVVIVNNAEPYQPATVSLITYDTSSNINNSNMSITSNAYENRTTYLTSGSDNVTYLPVKQTPHRTYTCYEPKAFFDLWDIVHIIMYSLLPFFIILVENATLLYLTVKHSRKMKERLQLNTSYPPLNKARASVLVAENDQYRERITIKQRLQRHFDKSQRSYRKSVNIAGIAGSGGDVGGGGGTVGGGSQKDASKCVVIVENGACANSRTSSIVISTLRRNTQLQTKTSHVTNLLLFLTVSFLFTTVPYSTYYAFRPYIEFNLKARNIFVGVLAALQYTRHSANFLIYLSTSTILRNELKLVAIEIRSFFTSKC